MTAHMVAASAGPYPQLENGNQFGGGQLVVSCETVLWSDVPSTEQCAGDDQPQNPSQ